MKLLFIKIFHFLILTALFILSSEYIVAQDSNTTKTLQVYELQNHLDSFFSSVSKNNSDSLINELLNYRKELNLSDLNKQIWKDFNKISREEKTIFWKIGVNISSFGEPGKNIYCYMKNDIFACDQTASYQIIMNFLEVKNPPFAKELLAKWKNMGEFNASAAYYIYEFSDYYNLKNDLDRSYVELFFYMSFIKWARAENNQEVKLYQYDLDWSLSQLPDQGTKILKDLKEAQINK